MRRRVALFVTLSIIAAHAHVGDSERSSDLRLSPHLHVVFVDGAYRDRDGKLVWRELPKLTTDDVVILMR